MPDATSGRRYRHALTVQRGQPPYTWTVIDGELPPVLRLRSDGVISGYASGRANTAVFTAQVRDATGDTATRVMTIRVAPQRCYSCHVN